MNRQITSRHPNFQLSLTATHNKVIANLNVLFTKATTLVPNNLSLKLHHFLTVYLSYTQLYIKCLIIIHNWLVHSGFVCHDRNKCRGKMNSWGGKCVKTLNLETQTKSWKWDIWKWNLKISKKISWGPNNGDHDGNIISSPYWQLGTSYFWRSEWALHQQGPKFR